MRWKLTIQGMVLGLLGVLLIGYANMGNPEIRAATDACKDVPGKILAPLPASKGAIASIADADTSKIVLKVKPDEAGCARLFSSTPSLCSQITAQTCTGVAASYCGAIAASSSGGGGPSYSCASVVTGSGFWLSVAGGASCDIVADSASAPANVVANISWGSVASAGKCKPMPAVGPVSGTTPVILKCPGAIHTCSVTTVGSALSFNLTVTCSTA